MKRLFSARFLVGAAVALGALGLASVAHARTDVTFSIGVNAPYGYVQPSYDYVYPAYGYAQPAPVYIDPQPVYVQPRPVYVPPRTIYYGHERRWQRRGPYGDWDHDGVPNRFDPNPRHYDQRIGHRRGAWRDADRDGVPNRYDRAPHNPYRR